METKQTAVEWLALYIKGITTLNCDEILEKAKAMEKEQIMDAYNSGQQIPPFEYAEKFYNETYKK